MMVDRSPGASIGRPRPRPTRDVRAEMKAEAALAERGFMLSPTVQRVPGGVVVVAVGDSGQTISHLGRDRADALYNLAALAARPAGREW